MHAGDVAQSAGGSQRSDHRSACMCSVELRAGDPEGGRTHINGLAISATLYSPPPRMITLPLHDRMFTVRIVVP
jgi:hypothetical protein